MKETGRADRIQEASGLTVCLRLSVLPAADSRGTSEARSHRNMGSRDCTVSGFYDSGSDFCTNESKNDHGPSLHAEDQGSTKAGDTDAIVVPNAQIPRSPPNHWSTRYVQGFGRLCSCSGLSRRQNRRLPECREIHVLDRRHSRYRKIYLLFSIRLLSAPRSDGKPPPFAPFAFRKPHTRLLVPRR
jgi:hypothetical protein